MHSRVLCCSRRALRPRKHQCSIGGAHVIEELAERRPAARLLSRAGDEDPRSESVRLHAVLTCEHSERGSPFRRNVSLTTPPRGSQLYSHRNSSIGPTPSRCCGPLSASGRPAATHVQSETCGLQHWNVSYGRTGYMSHRLSSVSGSFSSRSMGGSPGRQSLRGVGSLRCATRCGSAPGARGATAEPGIRGVPSGTHPGDVHALRGGVVSLVSPGQSEPSQSACAVAGARSSHHRAGPARGAGPSSVVELPSYRGGDLTAPRIHAGCRLLRGSGSYVLRRVRGSRRGVENLALTESQRLECSVLRVEQHCFSFSP